jgi:hypothetical protein
MTGLCDVANQVQAVPYTTGKAVSIIEGSRFQLGFWQPCRIEAAASALREGNQSSRAAAALFRTAAHAANCQIASTSKVKPPFPKHPESCLAWVTHRLWGALAGP